MTGFSPNFVYWRTRPTLKVWYIAAMMQGVDPYRMTDATDNNGDPLDLSDEMQLLISASLVGDITAYPFPGQLPDNKTEVSTASLVSWLRGRGYADLADGLDGKVESQQPITTALALPAANPSTPASSPLSRFAAQENAIVAALKALGYDPLQLPKNESGKAGVKAQVKTNLGKTGMWNGSTVFSKAWERLLASGAIHTKK